MTQLTDLLIAYGVTAASLLAVLLVMRAEARVYWRVPVYAIMAMGLGVLTWSLVRRHLMPLEWGVTHSRALFFCALGLYGAFGAVLGLLLGRLTGRKTPESNSGDES